MPRKLSVPVVDKCLSASSPSFIAMEHFKQQPDHRPVSNTEEESDQLTDTFGHGVESFNTGRLQQAASSFEKVLAREPNNSRAHYNLGLIRFHQEWGTEAECCFRRAVAADPGNSDAWFNLGQLLLQDDRPAEAAECYLELLESAPRDPEAHLSLGIALKDLGLLDEAIDCFEETVKLDPDYGPAYANLGVVLHIQGRIKEAVGAYRQAAKHGNDTPSNRHILNALSGRRTDGPPEQYVSKLFDGYAGRFDESLVAMGYQIPMLLRLALESLAEPSGFARAIDLGCGTGFSGLPFREKVTHLTGVDLSAEMLKVARRKEIYNEFHCGELVGFLEQTRQRYDLFLLTDVCVYLGKLDGVFAAIRSHAEAGALVLLSIELCRNADFVLKSSGRYAHSSAYLEKLASQNGMTVSHRQETEIRRDRGEGIAGEIYILRCS